MPKLSFFIGKGGVGKTTVSAAFAMHSARRHRGESVLLLSADPAHSLADIFQQTMGDSPARIRLGGGVRLHAWQINAEKEFGGFLDEYRKNLLSLLESGSLFSREDLEPLLDSALPGMAEMAALLAISDAMRSGKYDRVVVDTAPFGHTLRLFALPESFARFLDFLDLAASRDQVLAAHFGGRPGPGGAKMLAEWRAIAKGVEKALGAEAELFLVTSSEKFALNESVRCVAALRSRSPELRVSTIVLNRVVPARSGCGSCRKRQSAARSAQTFLKRKFPRAKLLAAEDRGFPVFGAAGLAAFGEHIFSDKPLLWRPVTPNARALRLEAAEWPTLETPLSLVLGKGGVGKTTISAALGFRTRAKKPVVPVQIVSVDPAPSLDDVFEARITDRPRPVLGDSKFKASEMDALKLFESWKDEIQREIDAALRTDVSKIHVDLSFERRLFSSLIESVPPGLDEILAVLRISELLDGGSERVIVDMAPTGHALDLLRTPERILRWTRVLLKTLASHRTLALARDAAVKVAELGKGARDLRAFLRDGGRAGVCAVMLPEVLPDRETERLIAELDDLRLPVRALFVNRVIVGKDRRCARCRRARRWQSATLADIKRRFRSMDVYIVSDFPGEVSGKAALRRFTGGLWRVR